MKTAYMRIKDITTLESVLSHLKSISNPSDIIVWLDWDDNIIDVDTNKVIEPEITKEMIRYMTDNGIHYSFITGRFYDSACDDEKRHLGDMRHNITTTMYPVMRSLGIDTKPLETNNQAARTVYKVSDENGKCVGILYMGIFFSGEKGKTIKNFLRQTATNKKYKIFVDDYEPYLTEVTESVPDILAYPRRFPPNY